ncbi:hypothetical protein Q0Z83_050260 [Actinoplanes sichuanensis]|uniref:Uncharacterized protein n=1 Tax=Actinoplanes sichuanensis TaxID=512349 RepID=A0ABW4ANG6_9ACTN|nr:hypothetical protein [Actinoplanes sichuanensis]BEL06835.1 hypothetical protein Q0Z83_050260 [Actinoplanes sichuanensis]
MIGTAIGSSNSTPPWIPASSPAAARSESSSPDISPAACMCRIPSASAACQRLISPSTTDWAAADRRPVCPITMLSGQSVPCAR